MIVKATRTGILGSGKELRRVRVGEQLVLEAHEVKPAWMAPVDEEAEKFFKKLPKKPQELSVSALLRRVKELEAELSGLKNGKEEVI